MSCRFIQFTPLEPMNEWVPMALRDTVCLRRQTDPARWNAALREHGIEVEDEDCSCVQNPSSSWDSCPFYDERT